MPRRLGRSGELRRGLPMRASGVAVQCSARLQRRLLRLDVCEALCSHVCLAGAVCDRGGNGRVSRGALKGVEKEGLLGCRESVCSTKFIDGDGEHMQQAGIDILSATWVSV